MTCPYITTCEDEGMFGPVDFGGRTNLDFRDDVCSSARSYEACERYRTRCEDERIPPRLANGLDIEEYAEYER